jgi:hypothetical protein
VSVKAVIPAFVLPDELREGPAVFDYAAAYFFNLLAGSFLEPALQGFNLTVWQTVRRSARYPNFAHRQALLSSERPAAFLKNIGTPDYTGNAFVLQLFFLSPGFA